jgi:hypothetical protein
MRTVRSIAMAVLMLLTCLTAVTLAGAGFSPASASQCQKYWTTKWVRTRFVSPADGWRTAMDNRHNPEVQEYHLTKSISRTVDTSHTFSGSVSTEVKAGLKFLAEGKVDVTFGYEYATHKSRTGSTEEGYLLKFPKYTFATWTYGFWTVTAHKARFCRDYQGRTWTVYSARQTWPVYPGWKYNKIAYAK